MPSWEMHCNFVASRPYEAWYLIEHDGAMRGAVYLTKHREIGIGVLRPQRGQGLGREAVQEIMRLHPGRVLANINPMNSTSVSLFKSLGFNLLQETYSHGT
jgi:RimJ/RimL family protein N-acetyltransferase